jgi:hypothetical protein
MTMTTSWTSKQSRAFADALVALGELYNEPVSSQRAELFLRMVQVLPFSAVMEALAWHGQSSKFFPRPADLRDRIENEAVRELQRALPPTRDWHVDCQACDDTGWQESSCDGDGSQACGRTFRHTKHQFVVPCPCRPTNPTYQRHRQEQRRHATGKLRTES